MKLVKILWIEGRNKNRNILKEGRMTKKKIKELHIEVINEEKKQMKIRKGVMDI